MFVPPLDTPGGTVDELEEIDQIPTIDEYDDVDDDATECSKRSSFFPYSIMPGGKNSQPLTPSCGGGTIRMEGWLNHTTSSNKNSQAAGGGGDATTTAVVPSTSSSKSSILSKTVSKKKQQRKKKQQWYFVLRGSTLSYYSRHHDVKAKGTFVLTSGCTVGPVMYGSLDDPSSKMEVATAGGDRADNCPLSSPPRGGAASTASGATPITTNAKKKKRKFYCVQVTWPINNKPSKDEKIMAKAKAQVAAESENLAIQSVEHSLEDYESTGNRSPKSMGRPKLSMLRARSDSAGSPKKAPQRPPQTIDHLPPDLAPPDLDDSDGEKNGNYHENPRLSSSLPSKSSLMMNTPAMALSGSHPFRANASQSNNAEKDNNASGSLSHETGLHKHYKNQIEKQTRDQQKMAEEVQKVMQLITKNASHKKTKKRVIQGTKVAAVSTAAITAGVLTAGVGLVAGLVFVGITAAAGGSGAVVGSKVLDKALGKYHAHQSQKSSHLIIGAGSYEEAMRWKKALEHAIKELVEESEEWTINTVLSATEDAAGVDNSALSAPLAGPKSPQNPPTPNNNINNSNVSHDITPYQGMTPKWVPIQGGGIALWGILGALGGGGGNLRIYREELDSPYSPYSSSPQWLFTRPATSAFPSIPRVRTDVGLVGQPFPPFKGSVVLKSNTLDAFMCLMCSGRIHSDADFSIGSGNIPVPNSGQIASFRIIETMDDHMDVIHLVFRPLYLFPLWTAPRDFVLYRFWKYDDDGTYQVCFDSGQHRDCPPVPGYVRGEMHSVYTIAPLKTKKKRGTAKATAATSKGAKGAPAPADVLMNEECLLSHVVQIDPRGWVPTISSIPFLRNQGYGDAFAIMALHQMLDVKEALDSLRFVAVPMDGNASSSSGQGKRVKPPRRLLNSKNNMGNGGIPRASNIMRDTSGGSRGNSQQQQIYMPTLEHAESTDDEADYDFQYSSGARELFSADGYHQSQPTRAARTRIDSVNEVASHASGTNGGGSVASWSNISSTPPPMIPEWWAEPDANSFRIRGKTYKADSKKINAGSSVFRLLAGEIVETDVPIMTGMCTQPKERVQLALEREKEAISNGNTSPSEMPPFVFVVNIALPGPPNYHMVFYYAVDDMSMIDGSDGTPSSKLCNEFIFGEDDTFRDNTFKLIPQIIEGNFMVRKAVGSTPAIMGNKIKQTYIKGDRFFELMIDTGSSAVAAGVIRICNGYAKMIVVDLAFLFEGYDESTLPERVLGTVRLNHAEFGKKLRFVESAED